MTTRPASWHALHKGLHWLVVLLLVMVWGAVELHEFYEKSDPMREWWKMLHFSLVRLDLNKFKVINVLN